MTACQVVIPGVGLCELQDHPRDGVGREVHRKGTVTWNGAEPTEPRFFVEPSKSRYHASLDCPALLAQEAVRLLMTKNPPSVRPCALCVAPRALDEAAETV